MTRAGAGAAGGAAGRLVGMPPFAIRVARLAASDAKLEELFSAHLPRQPVDFQRPS